ncbi:S46 family peptidase [Sediminitomix flava]|uniref:Dipeptidyl-peptidase n=1 Tax=Sediminitomix flava TaxID=379075 RepID=A0A315Z7J7_SEDFL|nr:S46 family peptidase [Sediminitomix flava]PWJ40212.1 peptidase S46-like protein [Sediminitomix flava]
MKRVLLSAFLAIVSLNAFAHEGMWLPQLINQLNEADMQKNGFKLTAEDIYSINKSSMKDAVVWFGRGCTGEVVSDQGLLLTNHHCGYGQIQSHSTTEDNYLLDGFWANNQSEELANEGLTASFIVRIDDVTKKVLKGTNDGLSEEKRQEIIKKNIDKIVKKASKGNSYEIFIKPFFYGNEYYMFVMNTFKDIRLVGAPPSSIGKFGSDTDNWVWPRHTGDFSVFRIYANENNEPAEYSENNKPYKPAHHFPISLKGVKEGDFTMVYGFPGRTKQYIPSYGVSYVVDKANPVKIQMRDRALAVMKEAMDADEKVFIQYASKYARVANYWKKWIGESMGLERLGAIDRKKELESEFEALVKDRDEYKDVLPSLEKLYKDVEEYNFAYELFIEIFYYSPEALRYAYRFSNAVNGKSEMKEDEWSKEQDYLETQTERFFGNYNAKVDQKLFVVMMSMYAENISEDLKAPALKELEKTYNGDFEKMAEEIYSKSAFVSAERIKPYVNGEKEISELKNDPFYQLATGLESFYQLAIKPERNRLNAEIEKQMATYVKGQMELMPKKYWPDANSTLRVTYGKVEGSEPRDGMAYLPTTTLEGVVEKRVKTDDKKHEFYVPQRLVDLYNEKDYGRYAEDGKMIVCFTGSNHTTGGNSGSPVINGEGQLIGINFDRSWESTMSDIMFDPERCRNITVDIRYVLFVIDKYAGAKWLVDEMTIVE